MRFLFLVVPLGILSSLPLWAGETTGRITVGGFASQEVLPVQPDGSTHNDYQTLSGRFYLNHSTDRTEYVLDLRDKHDFFNKLDKERQLLTDRNSFQARQASVSYSRNERGMFWKAGRFAVLQAGDAYADGAEIGYFLSAKFKSAFFGGYNPHRDDQTYLDFNDKAQNYGAYFEYSPKYKSWSRKVYMANAVVQQVNSGEVDRRYVYHNSMIQWQDAHYLSTLFYLDFVPKTHLQNANLNFGKPFGKNFRTLLTASKIDVIQYRRVQDIRETLDPSPYWEVGAGAKYNTRANLLLGSRLRYGKRDYDDLDRQVAVLSIDMPRAVSKKMDVYGEASHRHDFTRTGDYGRLGLGYFSDWTEYDFSVEYGIEKETDGSTLKPLKVEGSAGYQFSRKLFAVFSGQYSTDAKAEVTSVFFRLSYRFGDQEMPPLRDGAPPRGRQLF